MPSPPPPPPGLHWTMGCEDEEERTQPAQLASSVQQGPALTILLPSSAKGTGSQEPASLVGWRQGQGCHWLNQGLDQECHWVLFLDLKLSNPCARAHRKGEEASACIS